MGTVGPAAELVEGDVFQIVGRAVSDLRRVVANRVYRQGPYSFDVVDYVSLPDGHAGKCSLRQDQVQVEVLAPISEDELLDVIDLTGEGECVKVFPMDGRLWV